MNKLKHNWKHVFFRPWIGNSYEASRFGNRVLLLGESHYGNESNRIPSFTEDLTQKYVNHEWSHKFWTNLGQTILGRHHSEFDRSDVWEHVAFYNFVQNIVIGSRTPSDVDRRNASLAFFELLDAIKPDLIVGCGWRLLTWLPDTWDIGNVYLCDGKLVQSRIYQSESRNRSYLVPIQHPSSRRYSWNQWHGLFKSAHNKTMHAKPDLHV